MKDTDLTRREFLKTSAGVAVGLGLGFPLIADESGSTSEQKPYEIKAKNGMRYRRFGSTNWHISVIAGNESFPTPAAAKAIDIGVNYWHKANYRHRASRQPKELSNLIKKNKVRKSTMVEFCLDNKPKDKLVEEFKEGMKLFEYDYVDFYKMHFRYNDEAFEAFEELKQQGLVKYLSISFHEKPETVKQIVDKGVIDAIQIMVNPISGEEVRNLCAYCREKGVGVIAMKTMAGGPKKWESNKSLMERLDKFFPDKKSIAQAIVKDVLSIQGVSAVVNRCFTMEQFVEDALLPLDIKLSSAERKGMKIFASGMRREFCQMCGLCEDACPKEVNIRELMRMELYFTAYEEPDRAWEVYKSLPAWQKPEACDSCGLCDRACPYGISVTKKINDLKTLVV